jgi:hypothetical protein
MKTIDDLNSMLEIQLYVRGEKGKGEAFSFAFKGPLSRACRELYNNICGDKTET